MCPFRILGGVGGLVPPQKKLKLFHDIADTGEDFLGLFISFKTLFVGLELRGMGHELGVLNFCAMFDVDHFVIEDETHGEFRNAGIVENPG